MFAGFTTSPPGVALGVGVGVFAAVVEVGVAVGVGVFVEVVGVPVGVGVLVEVAVGTGEPEAT